MTPNYSVGKKSQQKKIERVDKSAVSPYESIITMAYPNNQKSDSEWLFHSNLVKLGPTLVRVTTAPQMRKNNTMCVVNFEMDGKKIAYKIPTPEIEDGFKEHVGQNVVLLAKGDDRKGTAEIVFQKASGGEEAAKPSPQKSVPQQLGNQSASMKDAKIYFHQAGNLMRIAVKKANDIAQELGLSNEHRQGIATTLFIQSERKGFIDAMPIDPITPEQLGWASAGKQETYHEPEPPQQEEEDEGDFIPF
jgi:hypothetical protein